MSLVTVDQIKLHLGLSDTAEDLRLQQFLDGVEAAIWQWLGRECVPGYSPFESVESTEYYDGQDRQMLVLKRRPVTAVAGVWVDRTGYYGHNPTAFADPATAWTIGQHFAPTRIDETEGNPGMLCAFAGAIPSWQGQAQRNPAWPRGQGNIKVTYTAGYAVLPFDLVTAICNVVAAVRQAAPRGMGLESETLGRYTYTLMKSGGKSGGTVAVDEIGQALSTLARYKEVNI
jgi:hypothetical protein